MGPGEQQANAVNRITLMLLVMWWSIIGYCIVFTPFAISAEVPEACRQYERAITAQAHNVFGLDAPIAVLAAQVEQESSCNPQAKSAYASGLTQFTPDTAAWLSKKYPTELGGADPTNVQWAIAAQALYMRDLTHDHPGATPCDTWAFGLSAYNGGEGWLQRDQSMCRIEPRCPKPALDSWPENAFSDVASLIVLLSPHSRVVSGAKPTKNAAPIGSPAPCGCDDSVWFLNVELTPDHRRSPQAIGENRGYPRRILLTLEPRYVTAGYSAEIGCHE